MPYKKKPTAKTTKQSRKRRNQTIVPKSALREQSPATKRSNLKPNKYNYLRS